MAQALTSAQLAAIRSALSTPVLQNAGEGSTSWGPPPSQVTFAGRNYASYGSFIAGWDDVPAYDAPGTIQGYNGKPFDAYDAGTGAWLGSATLHVAPNSSVTDFLPFAFVAAGFGAAVFSGAAVSSVAGGATESAAGGSGAFLGEGVSSGVPAWDAAASNAGLSLTPGGFITEAATSPATSLVTSAATSPTSLLTAAKTAVGAITTAAGLTRTAPKPPPGITPTPTMVRGATSNSSGWALVAAAVLGVIAIVQG